MSRGSWLRRELEELTLSTLFFGAWFIALLTFKDLILAEYHLSLQGCATAVIGALVLAKVVLLLEGVSFGARVRSGPPWIDVVLRTLLYSAGVLVVLILERGFEGRHEAGSFAEAVRASLRDTRAAHLLANLLAVGGALLTFNLFAVVRGHLGEGALFRLFFRAGASPPRDSNGAG